MERYPTIQILLNLDKVLLPLETQKTETQQKSKVKIKEKEQVKPQVAIA